MQADGTDARERAKFTGMAWKFQNPVFIKNLAKETDTLQLYGKIETCILLPPAKRMVLLSVASVNLCVCVCLSLCLCVLFVL